MVGHYTFQPYYAAHLSPSTVSPHLSPPSFQLRILRELPEILATRNVDVMQPVEQRVLLHRLRLMKLLLIEDDPEMADALRSALSRNGVVLDVVTDLETAREALAMNSYDIVLIDRQLPDGDGRALLADLKRDGNTTRSIIISALGSTSDRISGLNEGADDYLPKPFEMDELVARMNVLLRRVMDPPLVMLTLGNVSYDRTSRDITVNGERLVLTRRELLILETLMRNRGRTVLRTLLEERVYSFDDDIQSNSLEANMSRLRRKLSDVNADIAIKNVRGIGYFLHELG